MQQLQNATSSRASADQCAWGVLTGVPSVMRFLRHEMRRHRQAGLTVPQLRALVFVSHNHEPSVSAMAEYLGLSLPAASRMVELLVKRGLMQRGARPGDRRSVSLSLTRPGKAAFRRALRAAQVALAARLHALPADELSLIGRAMGVLSRAFAPENCRTGAVK